MASRLPVRQRRAPLIELSLRRRHAAGALDRRSLKKA